MEQLVYSNMPEHIENNAFRQLYWKAFKMGEDEVKGIIISLRTHEINDEIFGEYRIIGKSLFSIVEDAMQKQEQTQQLFIDEDTREVKLVTVRGNHTITDRYYQVSDLERAAEIAIDFNCNEIDEAYIWKYLGDVYDEFANMLEVAPSKEVNDANSDDLAF